MFVKKDESVEIQMYTRSLGGGRYSVVDSLKGVPEKFKPEFKLNTFTMRVLNWKESNDLLRESRRRNQVTQTDEIDWETHREKRLLRCLTKWDVKDDSGKDVPLEPENIFRLAPQIIDGLLYFYDKQS